MSVTAMEQESNLLVMPFNVLVLHPTVSNRQLDNISLSCMSVNIMVYILIVLACRHPIPCP